jgi:ATP-dependent DNA ligase
MLAKSVPTIPDGASYEPKWDGFRSICFRDGDEVEFGSRNERPLTRYFPELVTAAKAELPQRCVIDGEIVIATEAGLDFEALQQRVHPAASRVNMLAAATPASFIAFDLLALDDRDFSVEPFAVRRAALAEALAGCGPAFLVTPAKPLSGPYAPDKRVMFKIKHQRTADCVVAGYRLHKGSDDAVGSLLLGLYRDDGTLASVGVIGAFPMARRRELFAELQPLVTTFDDHPWQWAGGANRETSRWNAGKDLSFVPLRPQLVVEVRYDHMEGDRFRHTAQFNRWRDDRDPRSCTYEQLEQPLTASLYDIVPNLRRAEPPTKGLT